MEARADHSLYASGTVRSPASWDRQRVAETHAAELKQHAVAYINSDGNGRGFCRAEGSHTLENFVTSVNEGYRTIPRLT